MVRATKWKTPAVLLTRPKSLSVRALSVTKTGDSISGPT